MTMVVGKESHSEHCKVELLTIIHTFGMVVGEVV